ncbi:MAG TPA: glycogen debranching protein GlgX [Bryobacteraceae bacterium]|jgi:glycogen operon protein|nr:glycogen debranching protein GlgX [Bryobacteraceae bacterium]
MPDSNRLEISIGKSFPLGATLSPDGVNFSVFSKHATRVELLLFDQFDCSQPSAVIPLDRLANRTSDYWHVSVNGIAPGQLYGYRVSGPYNPEQGLRYDPNKLLLDPYGRSVACGSDYNRAAASLPGENFANAMKSVIADLNAYDWEGDVRPAIPFQQTVIYEMHVAGFTRHPNSGVPPEKRGTYSGLIERIPYLKDLGVTAVELLPIFQFDVQDAPDHLTNYWGYSPICLFAPHTAYSSRKDPLACLDEFRDMVKALHRAGLEVILDVVYNHTAEGAEGGPTLCFRGLENEVYYILQPEKQHYSDYTGCGNTLNANQAIVRRMIADSVRYWVEQMHVDGFRFDLASILSRDEDGTPLSGAPVLSDLDSDPVLAETKLIAEAWDAAGLYQVGQLQGDNWKEWNGKFRDDLRRFWKGDRSTAMLLPNRVLGSPELYGHQPRECEKSINFVTCHDGFTLNDLVSYNDKHNEPNLQDNLDGSNENLSWNCGVEGPTDDPLIEQLRNQQAKNFLAFTLLSVGVPMFMMGDEVRRTQFGNNNPFCQDNEVSWFDWMLVEQHADLHRFVNQLIALRRCFARDTKNEPVTLTEFLSQAELQWHGAKLNRPDWSEHSHTLAMSAQHIDSQRSIYFIWNAYWEPLTFELPELPPAAGAKWVRMLDTSLAAPDDICIETQHWVQGESYVAAPRSTVLLAWDAMKMQTSVPFS